MMAKIVNSWNDFDPLKHIIVGVADHSVIPDEEPATSEKVPVDSEMRGMWGPRPLETVEKANAQLNYLAKVLEDRGVKVDRPTPLQWNQPVITPDFRTQSMMTCMPPRDILLTIGNEIMASANSFRCRYFEYLAFWPLMKKYFDEDPEFKWTQAPRPRLTDKSYKHNYYDEKISLEERLVRTANKDFVTTEHEPMWDAADVMRVGKDLFIQHGLTTNRTAMEWFKRYYPNLTVHAVNFPGDPYPIHIDATFVPLRPGLIINNPTRRLPEEQRVIFEKNGWEIVDAAMPAHKEPPPLCYSSVWLSMNCLVLDHKTVICEASEVHQMEQMDKLGMNVIPVPFRDAYPFGGALHCATADVYREGGCEDYFPNRNFNDATLV
ncbi:serine/threonine protein kinase [Wielerella bovis]|nr:serine/threonine protein kinase [Wielerella bovis]ULJ68279.1 serine/threonine protein kinase [Wielerella bovis]